MDEPIEMTQVFCVCGHHVEDHQYNEHSNYWPCDYELCPCNDFTDLADPDVYEDYEPDTGYPSYGDCVKLNEGRENRENIRT